MKITSKPNKQLLKALKEISKKNVSVGWFESAKYEDGTQVAEVAVTNEFGDINKSIPPRPFMRNAISENQTKWKKLNGKIAIDIFKGMNVTTGFDIVGEVVATDVKKSITNGSYESLKTATVEARLKGKKQGKSVSLTVAKPLVDTGHLLSTLTSEVN